MFFKLRNKDEVSVLQDEKRMNGSDNGSTTMWLHLMPLNYTLYNGKDGKFYVMRQKDWSE